MRRFWVQLLLAILLGLITGTLISYYRTHNTIPSTAIPSGSNDSHTDSYQGDCGAWWDGEECST